VKGWWLKCGVILVQKIGCVLIVWIGGLGMLTDVELLWKFMKTSERVGVLGVGLNNVDTIREFAETVFERDVLFGEVLARMRDDEQQEGFVFEWSKLPDVVWEPSEYGDSFWRVDDWFFEGGSDGGVEQAEKDAYKQIAWLLFLKNGKKVDDD
jgi:hypothetical protein